MKTTQLRTFSVLFGLFALCAFPRAGWANFYQLDDGTAEDAVGLNGGGDIIALNQFNVIGGNDLIGSVSIAWGSPAFPDPSLNNLSYTAVIWSDPNGDGDPSDAIVLATAPDVVSNAGTNTFVTTLFPCVQVTPSFFVGFIITQGANQFPAAFDETSPLGSRSFLAASFSHPGDINNLTNNDFPVSDVQNYGLNGNFLIRADFCAVPEPTTLTLGFIGGLAGLFRCRRKVKRLFVRRHFSAPASILGGTIFVGRNSSAGREQKFSRLVSSTRLPSSYRSVDLRRSFASRKPQIHFKHAA